MTELFRRFYPPMMKISRKDTPIHRKALTPSPQLSNEQVIHRYLFLDNSAMLAAGYPVCGNHGKMNGLFRAEGGLQAFDTIPQFAFFVLGYMISVSGKLHLTEINHMVVTQNEQVNL